MLPIFNEIIRRRQENINFVHRRRRLRREFHIENIPERRFKELFRINKEMFAELYTLLAPYIPEPRYVNRDVSLVQKILVALRFYATGCYQRSIGGDFNMAVSQTSVHRYVHEVTDAIMEHLCQHFIKFPTTRREINEKKESFMNMFQFPGVVGVIDGTHIAILKPNEEHNFINRKGFHSINAQIVCDSNLRILSLNANYPGSCHDSFIWRNSDLHEYFLNQYLVRALRGTWLIGDSGYPLEPFLMTPFVNPAPGTPEANYNIALTRARNCVERCIGVLKTRFRCLLKERVARYNPTFVGKLINVCAALHNMCIDFNMGIDEDVIEEENDNNGNPVNVVRPGPLYNDGQRIRNNVVNAYF